MTAALGVGSVIAGHRIEAVVNSGGMGVVYRAVDTELDRLVAIKVIKPELAADAQFRERFQREARLVAAIDHPNVIRIWRSGEENGLMYVSMQFVAGTDLAGMIDQYGRLHPSRAARIIADVAAALDVAHSHGVVHRDVKPHNVLIEQHNGDERVILSDFGLATRLSSKRSERHKTRGFIGTMEYAAPEQLRTRPVDARTDVYALGCVLFHAVTGRVPFDDENPLEVAMAHALKLPPRLTAHAPDAPLAFDLIVHRALAKDPADRYASAGDLGQAALAAAADRSLAEPIGNVAIGLAAPRSYNSVSDSPPPSATEAHPAPVPAVVAELLRRAEAHRVKGNHASALADFDRALAQSPQSADALAGRGCARLAVRQLDEALEDFETALRLDSGSIYALTGRGQARLARREADAALEDFTKALTLDPGSIGALVGAAAALSRLRRFAEARTAIESALAIDPDAVDGVILNAGLAVQANRLRVAEVAADHAVTLEPRSSAAHATRALVRLAMSDLAAALSDLDRASELEQESAEVRALRGLVLARLERSPEAIAELDEAIRLDPEAADPHAWRAAAALWFGAAADAGDCVTRAFAADPDAVSAHTVEGLRLLADGKFKRALSALDRALERDGPLVLAYFGRDRINLARGRAALGLRRFNEAAADAKRALEAAATVESRPTQARAHVLKGEALLGLGRAQDALTELDRARVFSPRAPQMLLARTEALFALGRYRDALGDLDMASAIVRDAFPDGGDILRRPLRALPPPTGPAAQLFEDLGRAVDAQDATLADELSVAIVRAAAGTDKIDSEAAAVGIEDTVLVRLDALWRSAGLGKVRTREWTRSQELTSFKSLVRLQTWLGWRMKQAGI